MAECRELEKKYYSCFPFLLQMAILYLNHATLSDVPAHIYEHCIELTQRIRSLSEDVNDAKDALTLEASCYLHETSGSLPAPALPPPGKGSGQ